jgi:hypothetical protein
MQVYIYRVRLTEEYLQNKNLNYNNINYIYLFSNGKNIPKPVYLEGDHFDLDIALRDEIDEDKKSMLSKLGVIINKNTVITEDESKYNNAHQLEIEYDHKTLNTTYKIFELNYNYENKKIMNKTWN